MATTPGTFPVIDKMFDLVLWSCRHIGRFPRSQRFTLGERLELRLYDVLDKLVRARYERDRAALLQTANVELELLRFQFRLAVELKCLSLQSFEYAARTVNEIGAMIGGWLKATVAKQPSGKPQGGQR